jgi:hypothetical protein
MPAKTARFAARPPFGSSAVRVAVGTPRLSCREVRKAQKFTSVRRPSGESRLTYNLLNGSNCGIARSAYLLARPSGADRPRLDDFYYARKHHPEP